MGRSEVCIPCIRMVLLRWSAEFTSILLATNSSQLGSVTSLSRGRTLLVFSFPCHFGWPTACGQGWGQTIYIPLLYGTPSDFYMRQSNWLDGASYYIGWLCVGINSSIFSYFSVAWFSQWWLRTRYPKWFAKYNYIIAAALDGGTQVKPYIFLWRIAVLGLYRNLGHGFHIVICGAGCLWWFAPLPPMASIHFKAYAPFNHSIFFPGGVQIKQVCKVWILFWKLCCWFGLPYLFRQLRQVCAYRYLMDL